MKIRNWLTLGIAASLGTVSALAYSVSTGTVMAVIASQAGQQTTTVASSGMPSVAVIGAAAFAVWYYSKK